MGGSGYFYDRDVTNKSNRGSQGFSITAERELTQSIMDPALSPKRKLSCSAENPLVYDFDVTGSMGKLPKIIWDKWPGIVGQVIARKYLPDPEMSIAATGDIRSDNSPLQMANFEALRNLDKWFKRIHFEGNGGGQGTESYEMTAYYYAYLCEFKKARLPIYLITGDEGFFDKLYAGDLGAHFGGTHEDTTAQKVFADLIKKFRGNVFLIHRFYSGGGDRPIVSQWRRELGEGRIIHLPQGEDGDLAIGDITLGVYAIVSGSRTLDDYLEDMRTRPLDLGEEVKYEPQSPARIRQVEEALQPLKSFKPLVGREKTSKAAEGDSESGNKKSGAKWKL